MSYEVAAFLGTFIFLFIGIGITAYVFSSLGLMTMANKMGVENAWLAWIPLGNAFILGKTIGDSTKLFGKDINSLGMVLLVGCVIALALASVPVLGVLIAVAYAILVYKAYFDLFKMFKRGSEVTFLVLSILFGGIATPIILFIIRNNEPYIEQVEVTAEV